MTMITPSYLGETIEYSSLHACRSTLEDPTSCRILTAFNPRHPGGKHNVYYRSCTQREQEAGPDHRESWTKAHNVSHSWEPRVVSRGAMRG